MMGAGRIAARRSVSGLQMVWEEEGDTYMTRGMLQNHATRAFSAYLVSGGPDMATRVIDIALE